MKFPSPKEVLKKVDPEVKKKFKKMLKDQAAAQKSTRILGQPPVENPKDWKTYSVEFCDELADAYEQAAAACELHAGDFPAKSPARAAHLYAAKIQRKQAMAATKLARKLEAK